MIKKDVKIYQSKVRGGVGKLSQEEDYDYYSILLELSLSD